MKTKDWDLVKGATREKPEWVVRKARVEWWSAEIVGGMCRVMELCCCGRGDWVERAGVGRKRRRRKEKERRIVGRVGWCIVAAGDLMWATVGRIGKAIDGVLIARPVRPKLYIHV